MFFKFQGYHLAYISFFNDLFYVSVCAYGYPWQPEEDVGFLKLELEVIVSTNMTPSARAASAPYCELSLQPFGVHSCSQWPLCVHEVLSSYFRSLPICV